MKQEKEDYRTEDGQMWAEIRERNKARKAGIRIEVTDLIRDWAGKNDLQVDQYAIHAIRVFSPTMKIDIFPGSKKYHNITTQARGTYRSAIPFLMLQFNK